MGGITRRCNGWLGASLASPPLNAKSVRPKNRVNFSKVPCCENRKRAGAPDGPFHTLVVPVHWHENFRQVGGSVVAQSAGFTDAGTMSLSPRPPGDWPFLQGIGKMSTGLRGSGLLTGRALRGSAKGTRLAL